MPTKTEPQNIKHNRTRQGKGEKRTENLYTHESERASTQYFSCSNRAYVDYVEAWNTALDRRDIRLANINKRPAYERGTHWPTINEPRKRSEILSEYKHWGTRTGTKIGRKFRVIFDFDFGKFNHSPKYKAILEKGFLMIMNRYKKTGSHYNKTQNGYHATILLDKPCPNGTIYHINKWGKEEKIGDILSEGKQAQWIGGKAQKEPAGQGKWMLQFKDATEAEQLLIKYFFRIKWTSKEKDKENTAENNPDNIKVYDEQKQSEIISEWIRQGIVKGKYKSMRIPNPQILNIKIWARKDHHYLVKYNYQGRTATCILDAQYRAGSSNPEKQQLWLNGLWKQPRAINIMIGQRRQFLLNYE